MANIIGEDIYHKTYGKGKISEIKNNKLGIKFDNKPPHLEEGDQFLVDLKNPNIFSFLKFKDKTVMDAVYELHKACKSTESKKTSITSVSPTPIVTKEITPPTPIKPEPPKEKTIITKDSSGKTVKVIVHKKEKTIDPIPKEVPEDFEIPAKVFDDESAFDEPEEPDEVQFDEFYQYETTSFFPYIHDLDVEKNYVYKQGGKKCHLDNGVLVSQDIYGYKYSFTREDDQYFPDDGQIKVLGLGELPVPPFATIVTSDEDIVVIKSPFQLPESIDFTLSTFAIIDNLSKHIRNVVKNVEEHPDENKIAYRLLKAARSPKLLDSTKSINQGQKLAVAMSHKRSVLFIWGPPGTGKTYTLSKLALEHIDNGERVLMMSNSNVAVDGAALQVKKQMKEKGYQPGVILRYGYPHKEELLNDDEISSYRVAIKLRPDLSKRQAYLIERKKEIGKKTAEYAEIITELKTIKKKLKSYEKELVNNSKFIATTVAKACMDKILYESKYDVVIVDEASMLNVPQIVFAAGLATKHFVCVGDFMQLPPIVGSDSDKFKDKTTPPSILNKDIYDFTGLRKLSLEKKYHKWLVLLPKQRRMNPGIATFISQKIYKDLITSADDMREKTAHITALEPLENMPMVIADTTGMLTANMHTKSGSYFNILSAFAALSLAQKNAQKCEVGIITPYADQSRLINAMIKDINSDFYGKGKYQIVCSTVHSFQGSEQDIIIYDVPDCYTNQYPSILITNNENQIADRLFNVAMTRAKGKFINLLNYEYMHNHMNGPADKQKVSVQFFNQMMSAHKQIGYNEIFIDDAKLPLSLVSGKAADELFLLDLKGAKDKICLYITDDMKDDWEQIEAVLLESKCKIELYYSESYTPKGLYKLEQKENVTIRPQYFALNPMTIIDSSITWYGKPYNRADFISAANDCKVLFRPVFRFMGSNTARKIIGLMRSI